MAKRWFVDQRRTLARPVKERYENALLHHRMSIAGIDDPHRIPCARHAGVARSAHTKAAWARSDLISSMIQILTRPCLVTQSPC
jgi:hypothetical protein